jgi:imidazolonepropionase-like amidohydrolase
VKIVIVGAMDAGYALNLLKEKDIPVIACPVLRLPPRRDADFDQPFTLPYKLYQAGIAFSIASGGGSGIRNLPYHAAKAAAYNLPKDEALKAITLYAAQIIGVVDRLGSLEVGKDATFIVTDGDPLEMTTHVEKLYIEGRDIDLSNKHKELYEKYQIRYEQASK